MSTRPPSARLLLRSEVAKAVATLRTDPGLLGMKIRQRLAHGSGTSSPRSRRSGAPRPKIASIDQDLGDRGRPSFCEAGGVVPGIVYSDTEFRDALDAPQPRT